MVVVDVVKIFNLKSLIIWGVFFVVAVVIAVAAVCVSKKFVKRCNWIYLFFIGVN